MRDTDTSEQRRRMVERHVVARGVRDSAVLDAMRAVPREAFLPEKLAEFAYDDTPLSIEEGQTISQPFIVAAMAEALKLGAHDRGLEIGTGSTSLPSRGTGPTQPASTTTFAGWISRFAKIHRSPVSRLGCGAIERFSSWSRG